MYKQFNAGDFALKLKQHKDSLGLSSKELSIQADIDYKYFNNIENGNYKANSLNIIKILNTFGQTLKQFLEDTQINKREMLHANMLNIISKFDEPEVEFLIELAWSIKRYEGKRHEC